MTLLKDTRVVAYYRRCCGHLSENIEVFCYCEIYSDSIGENMLLIVILYSSVSVFGNEDIAEFFLNQSTKESTNQLIDHFLL